MERVAGDQDFFLWEKNEDVAIGVGDGELAGTLRAGRILASLSWHHLVGLKIAAMANAGGRTGTCFQSTRC